MDIAYLQQYQAPALQECLNTEMTAPLWLQFRMPDRSFDRILYSLQRVQELSSVALFPGK